MRHGPVARMGLGPGGAAVAGGWSLDARRCAGAARRYGHGYVRDCRGNVLRVPGGLRQAGHPGRGNLRRYEPVLAFWPGNSGEAHARPAVYGTADDAAERAALVVPRQGPGAVREGAGGVRAIRSEEHTSELQSLRHLV